MEVNKQREHKKLLNKVNECEIEDKNFDYVIGTVQERRVCFGSSIVRDTSLIGKSLSPFQRRVTPEQFPKTAPGCYHPEHFSSFVYKLMHKVRSKAGTSALCSTTSRFPTKSLLKTPPVVRYDLRPKWEHVKRNYAPFNSTAKLRVRRIPPYPGPIYNAQKPVTCKKTRFMDNFGKPSMIHCVETRCVAVPVDTCLKCNSVCNGDYWHKDYLLFLCQLCWNEEKATKEIYNTKALSEFKKIRNCSFMHDHRGTSAAIRIMTPHQIKKKIRLENYLDLFIKC